MRTLTATNLCLRLAVDVVAELRLRRTVDPRRVTLQAKVLDGAATLLFDGDIRLRLSDSKEFSGASKKRIMDLAAKAHALVTARFPSREFELVINGLNGDDHDLIRDFLLSLPVIKRVELRSRYSPDPASTLRVTHWTIQTYEELRAIHLEAQIKTRLQQAAKAGRFHLDDQPVEIPTRLRSEFAGVQTIAGSRFLAFEFSRSETGGAPSGTPLNEEQRSGATGKEPPNMRQRDNLSKTAATDALELRPLVERVGTAIDGSARVLQGMSRLCAHPAQTRSPIAPKDEAHPSRMGLRFTVIILAIASTSMGIKWLAAVLKSGPG
jgi:hypothetical protein